MPPKPITTSIPELGSAIKRLRVEAGRKQRYVASEAGISDAYLCNIEKGNNVPSWNTLQNILFVLGREVQITLTRKGA